MCVSHVSSLITLDTFPSKFNWACMSFRYMCVQCLCCTLHPIRLQVKAQRGNKQTKNIYIYVLFKLCNHFVIGLGLMLKVVTFHQASRKVYDAKGITFWLQEARTINTKNWHWSSFKKYVPCTAFSALCNEFVKLLSLYYTEITSQSLTRPAVPE